MRHHEQYFNKIAAAYIRGQLKETSPFFNLPIEELSTSNLQTIFEFGKSQKLKLYPFKRTKGLPRVQEVLNFLKGIHPINLLDIGTGRGVFLYPFLDQFPTVPVQCVDLLEQPINTLLAIQ